jgi:hypothetical protein
MARSIPYASSCDGPPSADGHDAAIAASSIVKLSSTLASDLGFFLGAIVLAPQHPPGRKLDSVTRRSQG